MFSFCSDVCTGAKAENSVKVNSPSDLGQVRGKRVTVNSGAAGYVGDATEPSMSSTAKVKSPMELANSADGVVQSMSPLPTAQDLMKEVLQSNHIFDMVEHEFCAFGSAIIKGLAGRAFIEPKYEDKKLEISGAGSPADFKAALIKSGTAILCKKGLKPEQPNQDNVLFCRFGNFTICGVADGHGPDGHWASHWAARYVLRLLIAEVHAAGRAPSDEVLSKIFGLTHDALVLKSKEDRFDLYMSGSTLSICVVDHSMKTVVAAWVGDSRCAICRPGGVPGESLTQDHKPQDREEEARIRASGGEVLRCEGDVPHRVFVKGGPAPGLAMSRAVGDCMAHSVGVSHVPGISRLQLEDHFVLCCSDGVWEFIESEEAGQMVSKMGREQVWDATARLCQESYDRWIKEEECMTDDISAICIYV